ncbi:MAG: Zn-dependent hydrolase [Geminicoccaceae bacterium]|nr:MAG: Zn-dependent hydrolase [Geminicoccaceae bacterium]
MAVIGRDDVGITREAFGAGENDALAAVGAMAKALGVPAAADRAGNLQLRLEGAVAGPALAIGSHLDSVPHGGNFDGAAGIAAGLLVLARYCRNGTKPPLPLELLVLRCEESAWFDRAYVGSLALWGGLGQRDLARCHRRTGRTLAQCLEDVGADVEAIARGEALRDPRDLRAFFEVHIEQGPVMVARGFPTAPVTAIRGNRRYPNNRIVGAAGHSGAVPRWLRHDAVFAFGELITGLDEHWKALQERGIDLVVTAGMVGTNAADHGMTRIPGELTFSLEFRSQSEATLDAFAGLVRVECETIGQRRGVRFELDEPLGAPPALLDPWLRSRLIEAAAALGVKTEPLPSGAGHDAAVFAGAGVPAAMLFVRNEAGSHNPAEHMEHADLLQAVDVLYQALQTTPWHENHGLDLAAEASAASRFTPFDINQKETTT